MSKRSQESYGIHGTTFVDRFGVWLSQRAIRTAISGRSDLELIEFGCGYRATHLMTFRHLLKRGVGVDFKIAEELKSIPNLVFYVDPIERVFEKLTPKSYDLVLLISVLEHLPDPLTALRQSFALLKPNGILLINVPTWRGKFFLEFSAFELGLSPKVEMDDHKMYYDKRDLWPLLVKAGFKPSLIKLNYHKFGLNLFAVVRRGND